MSLDGFIAGIDNDLSWLSIVDKKGEDYGYNDFNEKVDTYIVGRKTYDVVKKLCDGKFPPAEKYKCYIISKTVRKNTDNIIFYNGDIEQLISSLKSKSSKNIYCDGGAEIVKLLSDKNLIDEYIISVIPIILGNGIRLFKEDSTRIHLELISSKEYDTGLIQLHYRNKK